MQQPDRPRLMLGAATSGREVPEMPVAQALHAMLTQLEIPDDPVVYGPAAVYMGLGAMYVFTTFSDDLAAMKLPIDPAVMDIFKQVTADVATVFRDVAVFAEQRGADDGSAEEGDASAH